MKITVNSDRGDLQIKWSLVEELKRSAFAQLGKFMTYDSLTDLTHEQFEIAYSDNLKYRFNHLNEIINFGSLPRFARILNVGSGVGSFDLLLHQYLNRESSHYLLDRDEFSKIGRYYENELEGHGFYNSWTPLKDAIQSTELNNDMFSVLSPDDVWPGKLDMVISSYSWYWHYPSDLYLARLLNSLKKGGLLVLDVLTANNENNIEYISRHLGSNPLIVKPYFMHPSSKVQNQYKVSGDSHGACCLWRY